MTIDDAGPSQNADDTPRLLIDTRASVSEPVGDVDLLSKSKNGQAIHIHSCSHVEYPRGGHAVK
eukprot:2036727-Prymnesium_polylepis.1